MITESTLPSTNPVSDVAALAYAKYYGKRTATVRMTPDQYERLQAAARERGTSLNLFVLNAALAAANSLEKKTV